MRQTISPFHISIGPRAATGTYQVRAAFGREVATADLQLPDPVLDLARRLARPGAQVPLGDLAFLGRALGRALLAPPIRDLLLRSVKVARGSGRLQLQLQIAPPELAALPWELVTVGLTKPWSPALRDEYALVRLSRVARPTAPVPLAGPLRILAVAVPGEELQLDALETALAGAVRAGAIALRALRNASPAALDRALMAEEIHILHVAAPVALDERGAPHLLLRRGLRAADLTDLLAEAAALRLVMLAGPQGDGGVADMAAPALATALLAADLPATIVLGGALPAREAATFAAACYRDLAGGTPVDLAVTAGRRAVSDTAMAIWGLAQLRMAPGGEQLFALPRRPRRASARLPQLATMGAAAVALGGALLLGARALAPRSDALAVAHGLPTASLERATPSLPEVGDVTPPASGGLWKTLFGPTATPEPAPTPTAAPAPNGYATYLTKADDTIDRIAQRFGGDVGAIAQLNRLDPRAPLRANHPLIIPVYRAGEPGVGGLLIDRGNPAERKVALTFDIEIDDKTLYGILDVLRARGLHGTFFVTGHWVQAFPDAARAIVRDGHEIGNHSLTQIGRAHV